MRSARREKMSKINLNKAKSVHFFGVGGIGVSAIAKMALAGGKKVSGSDVTDSEILNELRKGGAEIFVGQKIPSIPRGVDLIVYSAAVEVADPKFFGEIKKLPVPSISYAEALGEISRNKFTIAVAGTHGKTTTTAMLATILIVAGFNPTVVVGSLMVDPRTGRRTNFIGGGGKYFVVEADEYRGNFLTLYPDLLVITNIDEDHLDFFRDIFDIRGAFAALAGRLPKNGAVVTDFSLEHAAFVVQSAGRPAFDYRSFDWPLSLEVPGAHNLANAKAAAMAAAVLGVAPKAAAASLSDFGGVARRFERRGKTAAGALVYDDYAHNPPKVAALLAGAREFFGGKRIIAVFQPHLYSRTKTLFEKFARVFQNADEVIFAPIFAAREAPDGTVSAEMLAEAVRKNNPGKLVRCIAGFGEIAGYLSGAAGKDDVIITIGAGDIYKVADLLVA